MYVYIAITTSRKILCRFNRKLFYFGLRANQDKCLYQENYSIHEICLATRKPVFGVCNQVRLKPACAATGSNAEISSLCWLVCWFEDATNVYLGWEIKVTDLSGHKRMDSRNTFVFHQNKAYEI